ncbi:MAG: hypothetical protein V1898_00115 [Patescibacteria group bacterium]
MAQAKEVQFRIDRVQGSGNGVKAPRQVHEVLDYKFYYRPQNTIIEPADPLVTNEDRYDPEAEIPIPMSEYIGPDDVEKDLYKELINGEYHVGGIIETFGIEWDREKCARDVWQNFYDASNYDLTGVDADVQETDGEYTITISGDAIYDFRKLLHIGGTGKEDDNKAAGGFGEGSAIASFVMLRDFNVDAVEFESVGWNLKFDLKKVRAGVTTEQQRGLFATLKDKNDRQQGNRVTIRTSDKKLVDALVGAKDLFYHEDNPDFKDPTFESAFGGFKLIDQTDEHKRPRGCLYEAGQRRHYDKDDKWDNLGYMHFWTHRKCLKRDRDRGMVTYSEVFERMIDPFIESLSLAKCEELLWKTEPVWDKGSLADPVYRLHTKMVERLKKAGKKYSFSENTLADDIIFNFSIAGLLRDQGFRMCHSDMKGIGMKSAMEKFVEMQSHFRVEANPEQQRKINLLHQAAKLLGRDTREVWLYSQENEKSIFRGWAGSKDFLWMADNGLNAPFFDTLATFFHEQDHDHGTDQSAEFSYALTDTLAQLGNKVLENHEAFQRIKDEWEGTA